MECVTDSIRRNVRNGNGKAHPKERVRDRESESGISLRNQIYVFTRITSIHFHYVVVVRARVLLLFHLSVCVGVLASFALALANNNNKRNSSEITTRHSPRATPNLTPFPSPPSSSAPQLDALRKTNSDTYTHTLLAKELGGRAERDFASR